MSWYSAAPSLNYYNAKTSAVKWASLAHDRCLKERPDPPATFWYDLSAESLSSGENLLGQEHSLDDDSRITQIIQPGSVRHLPRLDPAILHHRVPEDTFVKTERGWQQVQHLKPRRYLLRRRRNVKEGLGGAG